MSTTTLASRDDDRGLPFAYGDFKAVASDDPVKTDLELTCLRCGQVLCDVEHDDDLTTLVGVAIDHTATCTPDPYTP